MNHINERVKLTSSCRDCDKLPRVHNAGSVVIEDGKKIQYMFNGLKINYESYHSPWMNDIIRNLNGHHEPQEELCFYYLLELLDDDANMAELGCFWAYYTMFFRNKIPNGKNVCIEPIYEKMTKGIENIKLNNFDESNITFIKGYIGSKYEKNTTFIDWDNSRLQLDQYNIEKIVNDSNLFFDIIHSDIQGAELVMLQGSKSVLDKIGFFVISTHYDKHHQCINFLNQNNFQILVQHTIQESVSTDGLILAVNKNYIKKYESKISCSIQEYFNTNCKISRR